MFERADESITGGGKNCFENAKNKRKQVDASDNNGVERNCGECEVCGRNKEFNLLLGFRKMYVKTLFHGVMVSTEI